MSIVVEYIVSFIVKGVHLPPLTSRKGEALLKTLLTSGAFFLCLPLAAQHTDTTKSQRLDEVEISAVRAPSELRTAAPTQVVGAEEIAQHGSLQLSDALKQMAGVTLKDYGGVGGIKTVSARGLGSQFSAVTIDGIPVDDSQNGQVDLGRYTLGNTSYVSFSQGEEQAALLTARAYAAGNTLNMETAEPHFWPGERTRLKAGVEGGSFGLFSPSVLWEERWGKKLRSSIFVHHLQSEGDYPFRLYNAATGRDDGHEDRRRHSAVWMTTVNGNLFYTIGEGNKLTFKAHYLRGQHELPGPVSYYSQTLSGQSSDEELAFIQGRWKVEREGWQAQVLGKLRYSYDAFRDTTPGMDIFNDYRQHEAFLNAGANKRLSDHFDISLSTDLDLSHLKSNLQQRNDVGRLSLNTVAAVCYHTGALEIRAHALYTDLTDRVGDLDTMPAWRGVTPFVSLAYRLGEGTMLRLFYKQTFRTPNFSELYFFQLMPRNLRPEQAHQVNIGLTHSGTFEWGDGASCQLTLDGYYNRVDDKIVARPTSSMYYWSMQNLGLVDIFGVDATVELRVAQFELRGNYSFLSAVDHTERGSNTYGYQIVYTPRHSGGGSVRWENPYVNVGATAMVVGHRYSSPQNAAENRLPAYADIGISLDRSIDLAKGILTLRIAVQNVFDTQYEVVAAYPMMGRNWRAGVSYEF